jgi:hypothetical protein
VSTALGDAGAALETGKSLRAYEVVSEYGSDVLALRSG